MDDKLERIRFESITHGSLNTLQVIDLIKEFIDEDPDSEYSLVIGTDSHGKTGSANGSKIINLVTAVLVHRKGFGGKYFWIRKYQNHIHTLRDKIYAETMASIDFAGEFVPLLKENLNGHSDKYLLEIHIDVGEFGDTREMIKEVVGMVTGSGFIAKTKPYAYAASYVADKHT